VPRGHTICSFIYHARSTSIPRVFCSAKAFSLACNERQFGRRILRWRTESARTRAPVTRNSLAKCKIKVSNELKVIVHVNISRTHFVQGVVCARGNNKFVSDTQDTTRRRGRGGLLSYVLVCSLLLQMATSMEDLIKSGS
jgi:hypothetical protein